MIRQLVRLSLYGSVVTLEVDCSLATVKEEASIYSFPQWRWKLIVCWLLFRKKPQYIAFHGDVGS